MNTSYIKLSKLIISFAALFTIIIPSLMDLNNTHMTNPLWPPHARFHWSIQWFSITILNGIAIYLLWGNYKDRGSRLSIVMAGLAPILFWGSFFPSMLMPGTSTWPDGISPFFPIAPNVFMAVFITGISTFGIYLDKRSRIS